MNDPQRKEIGSLVHTALNEGVECIRLLNEIIVDFDQILDDEKFRTIEKIKTIGSTYMAASGINPLESERDELAHLCDLVDFAIEMKNKLEDINIHSFNTFQLRIGKHQFSMGIYIVSNYFGTHLKCLHYKKIISVDWY